MQMGKKKEKDNRRGKHNNRVERITPPYFKTQNKATITKTVKSNWIKGLQNQTES